MTPAQACPLCGGVKARKLYTLSDPSFGTVRCSRCRFVFMNPYPTDAFLDEYYRLAGVYGFQSKTVEHYARSMRDRIVLFNTLFRRTGLPIGNGYAVDFGAGMGMAVAALNRLGFEAVGIDKNTQAAAVSREIFGVDVIDIELDSITRKIDLFTMFDVLEHIKHPKNFLTLVREKMSADGVMAGAVPNFDGIGRFLHGPRSAVLNFPDHVSQFTKTTLSRILTDSGFEVLYIGFPPPYGVTITLRLRDKLSKILGDRPTMKVIANLLVKIKKYVVYPLPNWFAERTGMLGHSLVFVARKRQDAC